MKPWQLIRGDCGRILQKIATGSIAAVVSSPPYNIGKAYERRQDMASYADWIAPVIDECVRVLRPGGVICWQVGNHITGRAKSREVLPLDFFFAPILDAAGLTYGHRIIWHFGHGLHNKHSFSGRHETILIYTKGVRRAMARTRDDMGSIWKITNVKHNHPEKTAHPCQMPEQMCTWLIEAFTKPGDVVADPFAGSGSVGAAAVKLGRRALLIEKDAAYCAIARQRLQDLR